MRLMPVLPHFVVSLVPALTAMRARTFMAVTMVGILPSTLIVTNLGQALADLESTRGLLAPEAILALSMFGLLALFPVLYRHRRPKKS
jgi:uncharacterized membrane protein YdjX (TVP38/TMEM64 family)